MARTPRGVLTIVSRRQIKHAHPLSRFLWIRARRAMKVATCRSEKADERVFASVNDVFEAMIQLHWISHRDSYYLFNNLFKSVHGRDYDGSMELSFDLYP